MNIKQFGRIAQSILICLITYETHAQTLPTPEGFDAALKACVTNQKINLSAATIDSVTALYASENTRPVLRSSGEFLMLIPEAMRIEAFRLYADCIAKIAPQISNISQTIPATIGPPQPPVTPTSFTVCEGEYERACQAHEAYTYCGTINATAESLCRRSVTTYSGFTLVQLNSYGGNKCGYGIFRVTCK